MPTAADIIGRALRKSGVLGEGQNACEEDLADALADLNGMLAQWQRKRWLVYHLVDLAVACTGQLAYTVGPGGDFNVPRPDRIEAAFLRQLNTGGVLAVDYPLEILEAREDYNRVGLKTLGSFPQYVFYDAAYPLGSVYAWPVPSSLYELHITLKEQLGQVAPGQVGQMLNLPPEYAEALMWNLAVRLRPSYQMQPDPTITALALDGLNLIRNANAQVPRLGMPAGIGRPGAGYNIFSDRIG